MYLSNIYPYNLTILLLIEFSIWYCGSLTYNPSNFSLDNSRIDARGDYVCYIFIESTILRDENYE